jgi:hypothetical protein
MLVLSEASETTGKWEGEGRPETFHKQVSVFDDLKYHVYWKRMYSAGDWAERGHRKLLWSVTCVCVALGTGVIVKSRNCELVITFEKGRNFTARNRIYTHKKESFVLELQY